jgi:hypothetical protein
MIEIDHIFNSKAMTSNINPPKSIRDSYYPTSHDMFPDQIEGSPCLLSGLQPGLPPENTSGSVSQSSAHNSVYGSPYNLTYSSVNPSAPIQAYYNTNYEQMIPSEIYQHQHTQYSDVKLNNNSDLKQTELKKFFVRYEISPYAQEDITAVSGFEIIIIADDSSSMREPSEYISIETGRVVYGTRWTELQMTLEVVAELGIILGNGITICFLNRPEVHKNIKSKEQVKALFNQDPSGRTPLTKVLKNVMDQPSTKPKLILIATDGEPNDDDGYPDCDNFINLLKYRNAEMNRVSILACTTSNTAMDWLNKVDKKCKRVDVIDDYRSEKDQIISVQGKDFTYTHGDHILKMLLGAVLQKYDDLDEKPFYSRSTMQNQNRHKKKKTNSDCCIL